MPPLPPDHRARRIIGEARRQAETQAQDPLERELFHFVKTGETASTELRVAVDLYADAEFRHILNALILTNANEELVTGTLGLQPASLEIYRHFFFDSTVFAHNLAKTRYVKELTCSPELRCLYELAIERGPIELLDRYRIGTRPHIEPDALMKDALADMWGKFVTHRGYSVTSDTAKEALRWGEAALRTAKVVLETSREERKGASTVDDLRIALEIRNETKSLEDLGVTADDLVVE